MIINVQQRKCFHLKKVSLCFVTKSVLLNVKVNCVIPSLMPALRSYRRVPFGPKEKHFSVFAFLRSALATYKLS